jgi:calcineurin-like phosphoesterase family protein
MARDIWVISDTHLNHSNILNFIGKDNNHVRPFGSVGEMNERILTRWNEVVKEGDIVYHLGDVTFGSKDDFKTLWPQFKGSKRLIVGNHDDIKFLSSGGFFKKVSMWRMWPEYNLVFSHVPLHESQMQRYISEEKTRYLVNVHGHIHQNPSPTDRHINVSVEAVNYYPQHIEDLAAKAQKVLEDYGS